MPKPSFPLPRGMRDIEAGEMAQRLWVNGKILEALRKYGFQLVEPSAIESLDALEAKCGPAVRDEIYWFHDRSGRRLGLRFDLTVGLARMVASRYDLTMPLKLCSISNMWRYDEPQYGRYRCFYQWDAEIFGSPCVEADAEVVSLSVDLLRNLNLEVFETRISNRKITQGFLTEIGVALGEETEATLRVIDKYRKLSENELRQEFSKSGLSQSQIDKTLGFISIRGRPDETLQCISKFLGENREAKEGLNELIKLVEVLEAFKKTDTCILDMSVVRGIGYYDGIVFEIYDKAGEEIGAIVGGGRFDGLCRIFGRDLPATGVAGGIERIMLSLEKTKLLPTPRQAPSVFVAAVNDRARRNVLELVGELRSHGITADYDLKSRSLTRQLEYADSLNVPYAVIVGPQELGKGKVKLRNMRKREEVEVEVGEIYKKIPAT